MSSRHPERSKGPAAAPVVAADRTADPVRPPEPMSIGDIAAIDARTPTLWGQIRLKSPAGLKAGPITATVYMADDRSRFRVVDTANKTEFLSSLQFCKFILELRQTGRFDFERGPPSRRAARIAEALAAAKAKPATGETSVFKGRKSLQH